MKRAIYLSIVLPIALSTSAITELSHAGGSPENVAYPEGYANNFTHYKTGNRRNGKQVAVYYANAAAVESAKSGTYVDGSVVVMEIYKTIPDANGKPTVGEDGVFKKGKFAAVGVMEKQSDWSADYTATERAGGWGFALYKPDGSPKENKLDCASCHLPLTGQDYLFSHYSLAGAK